MAFNIRGEFVSAGSDLGWNFRLFWIFDSESGVEGPLFSLLECIVGGSFVYVVVVVVFGG